MLGSQFRDIVLERSALERNCGGEDGGEDGGDGGGEYGENDNDDDALNIQGLVLTARVKCVLMTSLHSHQLCLCHSCIITVVITITFIITICAIIIDHHHQ